MRVLEKMTRTWYRFPCTSFDVSSSHLVTKS
jgi:hypothetical protein